MPIEFRFPTCQKLLRTPDSTAGKQGRCPHCQSLMQIPAAPASDSGAPTAGADFSLSAGSLGGEATAPLPPPPPLAPPSPLPAPSPLASTPPAPATSAWSQDQSQYSGGSLGQETQGLAPLGQSSSASSFPAANTSPWSGASNPNDLFGGLTSDASAASGGAPAYGAPQSYPATPSYPAAAGAGPYAGGYTSGAPGYSPAGYTPSAPAPGYASGAYSNPYAAPTSGYPAAGGWGSGVAPHRGNTILTLGIVGLITSLIGYISCCCCPLIYLGFAAASLAMGIPAWVMASKDLKAMSEGRMDPNGQGSTKTGMILGIICLALAVVSSIAIIILYAFGVAVNMQDFQ